MECDGLARAKARIFIETTFSPSGLTLPKLSITAKIAGLASIRAHTALN